MLRERAGVSALGFCSVSVGRKHARGACGPEAMSLQVDSYAGKQRGRREWFMRGFCQGRRQPLRVIKCQPCIASTATGPGRSPTSQGAAKHFPSFLTHPPAMQTVSMKTTSRARNPLCPQAMLYQACIDTGSYQGLTSAIRSSKSCAETIITSNALLPTGDAVPGVR